MNTKKIKVGQTSTKDIPTKVLVAQGVGLNDLDQETLVPRQGRWFGTCILELQQSTSYKL